MKYISHIAAILTLIVASLATANEVDPLLIVSSSSLKSAATNSLNTDQLDVIVGGSTEHRRERMAAIAADDPAMALLINSILRSNPTLVVVSPIQRTHKPFLRIY